MKKSLNQPQPSPKKAKPSKETLMSPQSQKVSFEIKQKNTSEKKKQKTEKTEPLETSEEKPLRNQIRKKTLAEKEEPPAKKEKVSPPKISSEEKPPPKRVKKKSTSFPAKPLGLLILALVLIFGLSQVPSISVLFKNKTKQKQPNPKEDQAGTFSFQNTESPLEYLFLQEAEPHELRIGSFNIQVFGPTMLSDFRQVGLIKRIIRKFDIISIQEVRNKDPNHLNTFLQYLNDSEAIEYEGIISARTGRSNSKEQYMILWNPEEVNYIEDSAYMFDDPEDDFEREPYAASFRSGNFDFTLVTVHIKPSEAYYELNALANMINELHENSEEKDIIVVGDFNADGDYFDESSLEITFPNWRQLISNDMDTMVKTDYTYDRIMVRRNTLREYVKGSANPWHWPRALEESDFEFIIKISDHYPVSALFDTSLPDDD